MGNKNRKKIIIGKRSYKSDDVLRTSISNPTEVKSTLGCVPELTLEIQFEMGFLFVAIKIII